MTIEKMVLLISRNVFDSEKKNVRERGRGMVCEPATNSPVNGNPAHKSPFPTEIEYCVRGHSYRGRFWVASMMEKVNRNPAHKSPFPTEIECCVRGRSYQGHFWVASI